MLSKVLYTFLLFLTIQNICSATLHRRKHHIDIAKYNASYYNPETGVGLKAEFEDSGRDPEIARIAFRGLSCLCDGLICNCCAGINLTAIHFDRRACTKFVYDPSEFALKIVLSMNEREIYTNSISAKNPPPLCTPAPVLPFVSFCVRLFDIYTAGKNLHACIDLETRIIGQPILILHFNCVKMGVDGITWMKPGEEAEPNSQAKPEESKPALESKPEVSEPEVYDEVDFEQQDLEVYVNYTSTLSPEEEAQIGQLKL
ncbi:uncharacterized protein LOC143180979 [Calliopsis andreniformis]|uniref:uncharacterized protein LOC143180979 n=1 Tax=Calliopsis andreniformis TaxID=337506 RepID=UPI003FCDDC5F